MRRRRRWNIWSAAWLLPVMAGARVDAQLAGNIDASWASIRYDEYLRSSVLSLSPSLRLDYPRSTISARGTISRFESGSRSLDLAANASTFTPPFGVFRLEISAGGGGTIYNEFGTGHGAVGVRLHALGTGGGAWLGGSGGYVDDGILGTSVLRLGVGAWKRVGDVSLIASGSHLRADQVAVTDIEGGLRFTHGAINVVTSAGARLGGHDVQGARQWGELSAVWWLARHVAVVGAHGRYPSEPGRGTPGGRYTTFSLRLATRAPVLDVAIPRRDRAGSPDWVKPVVASFQARRESDSTYLLTVRAPGAGTVEIAGDFNDWQPAALLPTTRGDNFTLRVKLSPGAYKYIVRVDGGEWGLPPGVPVLRDDFAGTVALLVIPRG